MKNYKKFRLQVVKGAKEYYQVFIFDDRMTARMFSTQIGKRCSDNMEAATHSFDAYKMLKGRKVRSDMIGAIILYKGGFGHGVVSHEIAHAVNYYFMKRRIKFDIGTKPDDVWQESDEVYATILGYMVNQFWKKQGGKVGKERY